MSENKNDSENHFLAAALDYASRGFKVVPCYGIVGNGICTCGGRPGCKPGKHPIPTHGHLDATTDPDTIRRWWRDHPWANVGIVVGETVFVWDIDPRNGGDKTMDALAAEHGHLPTTPTVATGGGGEQYYFRLPPGVVIKSRAVAPGIDVKGNGLVIAPPSMHATGNRYQWVMPLATPLADAPDWLLAMAAETPTPTVTGGEATGTRGISESNGGFTMGSAEPNDFASHPGADMGTRNQTMCRLLGVHLSRGDSPATVESLALAWGARCNPPIPESAVMSRLRWAESKRTRQPSPGEGQVICSFADGDAGGEDHPHATHTLSTPDGRADDGASASSSGNGEGGWPVLTDDAYHGLAGAIVNAIAPETEADPTAVLLSLLTAFGNAVGSGPQFNMLDGDHYANLFVGLVGGTASGKGRSARIVRRLMGSADPEWERGSIVMSLSSGEGFVEKVKDDDLDEEQQHFSFAMPEAKRLLIIESEFARTFGAMGRKENTLSGNIRSAWDHDVLEVNTRAKNRLRASNAHVSMIFHCTPEELSKLLSNSIEVVNGFSNRILWVLVRRSNILPRGGRSDAVDPFGEPMAQAIARAKTIGSISWDAEAGALWDAEYEALTEEKPGAYGAATQRAHAQTLRLSMLYALLDGSGLIRAEHLRAALAVWKYCDVSAKRIFGGCEEQGQVLGGQSHKTVPMSLHMRLLDAIAKNPGISRRGLHEGTGNRVKAEDLEAALASLEAQALAHRRKCQPEGGGRPAECWWPGPGDDTDDDDGDAGKGVTFTMGGGDPVATDSASASTHARVFAASIGRPVPESALGETEGDIAGLRTNIQTPTPTPVPEIVSSQSFFAGGNETVEGSPPPPSPESDMTEGAKAPSLQPHQPTTYPSPTPTPDTGSTTATDTPGDDAYAPPGKGSSLPKCSCGAVVERPGDEFCPTCFEAELGKALTTIADAVEGTNSPFAGAGLAAPPS